MRGKESDLPYGLDLLDERATAFHDCICFMRQAYPNFGITTYDRTVHRGAEQIVLAKFVTGIGEDSPVWSVYENTSDVTTADNIECSLYSGYDPAAVTRAPEQHGGIVKNLSAAAWGGGNVLPPESLVGRKVHKRETFSAEFKPERAAGAVNNADHSASQMFLHRIFKRGFVAPDKQRAKFDIVFASVR